jgi:hypothetical protein
MPVIPEYVESDIDVAAWLKYKGKRLLRTESSPGKPFRFVFDNTDNTCARAAREYLVSNEKHFAEALKDLRTEIRIAKNDDNSRRSTLQRM